MSEHHRRDSMDNSKYYLKTKDGRIVTVHDDDEEIILCAEDIQNEKEKGQCVQIKKHKSSKKRMAFIFLCEKTNYLAVVDGQKLKLVEKSSIQESLTLPDGYWFEKVKAEGGDYYILQSVVNRNLYICGPHKDDDSFFVSSRIDQSVHVKEHAHK